MTTEFLRNVLQKDIEAVRNEMRAYSREEDLWVCPPGITNSGGTLVLHITGNLRHFIGAVLGGIAYARDREAEFTDLHIPLVDLETRIDFAAKAVAEVLDGMNADRLTQEYPLDIDGARMPTGMFLLRLVSHLAYHLGQINYHRRRASSDSHGRGTH
jgi:hypothetical protein